MCAYTYKAAPWSCIQKHSTTAETFDRATVRLSDSLHKCKDVRVYVRKECMSYRYVHDTRVTLSCMCMCECVITLPATCFRARVCTKRQRAAAMGRTIDAKLAPKGPLVSRARRPFGRLSTLPPDSFSANLAKNRQPGGGGRALVPGAPRHLPVLVEELLELALLLVVRAAHRAPRGPGGHWPCLGAACAA